MMNLRGTNMFIHLSNELLYMYDIHAFNDSSTLLGIQINEGTSSNIIGYKLGYKLEDRILVKLLIRLDLIAYVPFGKKGMNALDKILSKFDNGSDSIKFKIDKMLSALQNNKVEISDELKNTVEKFCHQYSGSIFDLSDPVSFAALVRRLDCEIENSVVMCKVNGVMREKAFSQILDQIYNETNEKNRIINLENYIPKEKNDSEFDEAHKNYFKKITGFSL